MSRNNFPATPSNLLYKIIPKKAKLNHSFEVESLKPNNSSKETDFGFNS